MPLYARMYSPDSSKSFPAKVGPNICIQEIRVTNSNYFDSQCVPMRYSHLVNSETRWRGALPAERTASIEQLAQSKIKYIYTNTLLIYGFESELNPQFRNLQHKLLG